MATEQYWLGWYKGLTNAFLDNNFQKQLFIAEKERMDKDMTSAYM